MMIEYIKELHEKLAEKELQISSLRDQLDLSAMTSPSIDLLAPALAQAQAAFKGAMKNKKNDFLRYEYADLDSYLEAVQEPLNTYGLSIVQPLFFNQDGDALYTRILHTSGQWIQSRMRMHLPQMDTSGAKKTNPLQEFGSYISYLRRYSIASLLGIARTDEDDDGQSASTYVQKTGPERISADQLEQLHDLLQDQSALTQEILQKMRISSLADMPKSAFLSSIKRIQEIIRSK